MSPRRDTGASTENLPVAIKMSVETGCGVLSAHYRPRAAASGSQTYGGNAGRIQPINATDSLNISAGVLKPSVLRGLSFNCLAIALSCSCE